MADMIATGMAKVSIPQPRHRSGADLRRVPGHLRRAPAHLHRVRLFQVGGTRSFSPIEVESLIIKGRILSQLGDDGQFRIFAAEEPADYPQVVMGGESGE
jgi:hypothetical protein